MRKTCIKCGHLNNESEGLDTDSCPACGVIYAKARPPLNKSENRAPSATWPPRPSRAVSPISLQAGSYIDRLRSQSNYPAFRSVVSVLFWLGQVIAVLVLIGGLLSAAGMRGFGGSMGAAIGALVFSVVISVFAKVGKEASLMLADMSDATVRMAERQDADG